MEITPIKQYCDRQITCLHIDGIRTGFISSLGQPFVQALYAAIIKSKDCFGFVAEENTDVVGFIVFTKNLNKLYKSIIFKNGLRFALLIAGKMFSFNRIKKIFETLLYPNRIKSSNLPSAELLSIVVAKDQQGRGLGTKLAQRGLSECASRGIDAVKVLVGAENQPANQLYLKCGFKLVGQIFNHGVLSNIYVAKTN